MSDDLDALIKKAKAQKIIKQTQLLERKLAGGMLRSEHESAMAEQRNDLLRRFGEVLGRITPELIERRIVKERARSECEEAIGELLGELWEA